MKPVRATSAAILLVASALLLGFDGQCGAGPARMCPYVGSTHYFVTGDCGMAGEVDLHTTAGPSSACLIAVANGAAVGLPAEGRLTPNGYELAGDVTIGGSQVHRLCRERLGMWPAILLECDDSDKKTCTARLDLYDRRGGDAGGTPTD